MSDETDYPEAARLVSVDITYDETATGGEPGSIVVSDLETGEIIYQMPTRKTIDQAVTIIQ